jgi:hypothetical protein
MKSSVTGSFVWQRASKGSRSALDKYDWINSRDFCSEHEAGTQNPWLKSSKLFSRANLPLEIYKLINLQNYSA